MKKIFSIKQLVVLLSLFIFSSATIPEKKITIALAANAHYAFKEIEKQYEKETGKEIELIIASSGKLSAQIREGAPFDIFLSADMVFPNRLHSEGLTVGAPKVYAYGSLVLWSLTIGDELNLKSLLSSKVKTIAIANPKLAPYGVAAIEVMKYYKMYDQLEKKLVYGESISQVNQYVSSNAVDVGFTAKSVVMSPETQGKGRWIDIDKKAYSPIEQGAVLLKHSSGNKTDAEAFYNYIYSTKAQTILKKYGYHFTK
ncbi:MAG: molybdate ABC transporter substrate-binding protein [Bacteroidetes bacterium]|nr:molybdate ABC transporter substrate-binding protein [Bacteroidota bacterium]